MNPVEIFKCLGDETRYKILCLLSESDSYVELIASRLSLTPGTISFHLKKMEKAGLVKCSRTQYYMIYSLNKDVILKPIFDFLSPPEKYTDSEDAYRNKVIDTFFENGRLKQLPVQKKKRDICFELILSAFEAGKSYTEKEVNGIISKYYEDYCLVRRWAVDEGYMQRSGNVYILKANVKEKQ